MSIPVFCTENRLQFKQHFQPYVGPSSSVVSICCMCIGDLLHFCSQHCIALVTAIHNHRMYCGSKEADHIEIRSSVIKKFSVNLG